MNIFFEDQVYDWGRFQKTDTHTRTKITPRLPPIPPRAQQHVVHAEFCQKKCVDYPLYLCGISDTGSQVGCTIKDNVIGKTNI